MKRITLLLALFILVVNAGFAQEEYGIDTDHPLPEGLNIGDKAPYFKAHDLEGNLFDSKKVLKDKDIIVIFYRGYWCSACDLYLSNLSDSLDFLLEKGAVVVAITPETPLNAIETAKKTGADFIILSDHTEEIMEGFDVVFKVNDAYQEKIKRKKDASIRETNEQDEARLPIPATYVIHHDGKIGFKHFDLDYNNRASVAQLIQYLD
jgi:peroxiredoxin